MEEKHKALEYIRKLEANDRFGSSFKYLIYTHKDHLYKSGCGRRMCPYCSEVNEFEKYFSRPRGCLLGYGCLGCSKVFSQDEDYDIEMYQRYPYRASCPTCNKCHTVITQEDSNPEYYTDVNLICDCGGLVGFSLPVN